MKHIDFQHHFLASILNQSESPNAEFLGNIIAVGELNPLDTLAIYRQDYQARLSETLGELFETVWMVVGDEEFRALCLEYIEAHPSDVQNLMNYGSEFAAFISSHRLASDYPFLVDCAQFEFQYWRIFHDANTYGPDWSIDLQQLELRDLKVELDPNTLLVKSSFALADLFSHRHQSAEEFTAEIEATQHILVYKITDNVRLLKLSSIQHRLLEQCRSFTLKQALKNLEEQYLLDETLTSEIMNIFPLLKDSQVALKII